MKNTNKYLLSAILDLIVYAVSGILNKIVFGILTGIVLGIGVSVSFAVNFITTFVAIFATVLVYFNIIKKNVSAAKVMIGSAATALIIGCLSFVRIPLLQIIITVVDLVIIYFGVLVILTLLEGSVHKKAKKAPNYISVDDVENIESLRENILSALKSQLKAPLTAVLCEKEQMSVTENDGVYNITGHVNSQNSYGAMISTDFTVLALRSGDSWVITKTVLGVKNAVNYAKSFVANYILISIIVTILAALGFFVMKMIYGF